MKEAFEKIRKRLEPEADFFSGEPMGSLQKAYYCKGVEKAMEIVSKVEAEYINKSTEHINKSGDCSTNCSTNADRIRAMNDEELAEWLHNITQFDGDDGELMISIYNLDSEKDEEIRDSYGDLLEWLKSPTTD